MKPSLLLLGFLPLGVWASNVLELTESDFDQHVGAGKPPALVEFYAPWCGHCKNLAPVYEQLGDAFSHAKDKVSIVKVDADGKGKALGAKYGVTGFPTLKWFKGDGSDPEAYNDGRDLEALAGFVSKKTGVKSSIKPPPPQAVISADIDSFKDIVMDPKKDVLVAFTAPWCGHCKNMKPALESVAQTFKPESDCIIVNVDADAQHNRPLGGEYSITSFPTIKFFPRANSPFATVPNAADTVSQTTYAKYGKHAIPYERARNEADFVAFLNQYCGTNRAVGGGLNTLAGRLTGTWDSWAQELMGFAGKKGEEGKARMMEIVNLMKAGLDEVKAEEQFAARWYIRASEKIVNNTESWLEKESKRLNSMLAKKNLAQAKLDEVRVKANILAAFVAAKGEEAAENVKETVEDLKQKAEQKVAQVKEEL